MLIQAEYQILEEIPETIHIGDERFIVFVEERKPRCFKWSKMGYVRAECKPPREVIEKKGEEEKEKEINK